MEPGGFALLAGDASVDSRFREIYVLRAWHVYLVTGFDFREKKSVCFGSIGVRVRLQSPTLPLYYGGKVKKTIFPQNSPQNSPHGKFHPFLFPFSRKFLDLNFASYVLYNLPVLHLCHMSRTVSLGYLW